MKRVGYAGLFFLAGIVFPVLIWVAAVVAIRRLWLTQREARLAASRESHAEPEYPPSPASAGEGWAPRY